MLVFVLNFILFAVTVWAYVGCFRTPEGGWSVRQGLGALRFFTLLSNLFCALAALLTAVGILLGGVSHGVWLMKYIGTAAVTVTLLTVLFFLGPNVGYKALLSGRDLYLHLLGPLLAIVRFCFAERFYPLSFSASLLGVLPVILYGSFYLYKVVLGPEKGRWEDFYGYNKDGKWPIAFAAMVLGALAVCAALWGLCQL